MIEWTIMLIVFTILGLLCIIGLITIIVIGYVWLRQDKLHGKPEKRLMYSGFAIMLFYFIIRLIKLLVEM